VRGRIVRGHFVGAPPRAGLVGNLWGRRPCRERRIRVARVRLDAGPAGTLTVHAGGDRYLGKPTRQPSPTVTASRRCWGVVSTARPSDPSPKPGTWCGKLAPGRTGDSPSTKSDTYGGWPVTMRKPTPSSARKRQVREQAWRGFAHRPGAECVLSSARRQANVLRIELSWCAPEQPRLSQFPVDRPRLKADTHAPVSCLPRARLRRPPGLACLPRGPRQRWA
jgi:hypothetical protein